MDDDREQNRQTSPSFNHEMQHRIDRVVVILAVPVESEFIPQATHDSDQIGTANRHGQAVELVFEDFSRPTVACCLADQSAASDETW